MHVEALPHHTPVRPLSSVPGLGLFESFQSVPFHCSMREWFFESFITPPTATHRLAVRHVTLRRTLCGYGLPGLGLATTFQLFPSHCSTRDRLTGTTSWNPTATQLVALTQLTPES